MTPAPKRLRIGHATYEVACNPTLDPPLVEEGLAGVSNGNLLRIAVRSNLPHQTKAETLLHEVLHQCLFVTGRDLERDLEESIVRPLSMALFGVLRDNPKLVTYLLDKE